MKEYTVTFSWETEFVDAENPEEARLIALERLLHDLRKNGQEMMDGMEVEHTGESTEEPEGVESNS